MEYLGCHEADVVEKLVRTAYATPANLCIVPLQDILELDSSHRMNTPGKIAGNWKWRCTMYMLAQGQEKLDMVRTYARTYGRLPVQRKAL
jgi:4-alpha-glucanotransferase